MKLLLKNAGQTAITIPLVMTAFGLVGGPLAYYFVGQNATNDKISVIDKANALNGQAISSFKDSLADLKSAQDYQSKKLDALLIANGINPKTITASEITHVITPSQ